MSALHHDGATHRYVAYGLTIGSQVELPELAPSADASPPDIRIARTALPPIEGFEFASERVTLAWETVGRFRVTPGLIEVDPAAGVDDDLVAFPLLGPVLAVLLHMHGLFLVHASAVCVNGRAFVLMGNKGAGKSTTAAALVASGHGLLCDDIVAIAMRDSVPHVLPGFGQMKLSREATALLQGRGTERPAVHEAIDKLRIVLPDDLVDAAERPLGALLTVRRGNDAQVMAQVMALATDAAMVEVMRFSYMARFSAAALDGEARARHFRASAALADAGLVHTLKVPDGIERLADLGAVLDAAVAPAPVAARA